MTLPAGTKLGRYEIRSKIGAGGMGEVYLTQDTQLRRLVALKILPSEFTQSEDRLGRFEQEAYAASALNHPNIITIHEIGTTDSLHYIVTEYVDGESLRQHMNSAPVKLSEVLEIAIQIASALSAAHVAGIIHRDIKPENVMLRRDGIVKLLDFGLAKLTLKPIADIGSEEATRALVNTGAGVVMGTASYMSPEQARGVETDARTDIWSLGVILYEMAAGKAPFQGTTPTEIIARIIEREPASLGRAAPELPAELERIVTKALAKDREERYQTARDLLIDLRGLKRRIEVEAELERTAEPADRSAGAAAAQGEQTMSVSSRVAAPDRMQEIAAQPPSNTEIFTQIEHHKRAVIAVLLAVAAAIALGFYLHARNTQVAIESIAVLPFVNASGNADVEYLSDGMTESLINSLSQLPKLSVKARSTVFRYKGREADPQKVGSELNVQAVLNGRVTQRGDDLTLSLELVDVRKGNQVWGEQYNRKLADLVALQGAIARDVSEKLRLRLTSTEQQRLTRRGTENAEAYQAYLKGQYYWYKFPAPGYEKSGDYFQRAIDLDPTYALGYAGLSAYFGFASANGLLPPNESSAKAEAAANKALALDETLPQGYHTLAAAKLYYYRDWPAAERYFRRAIELNPNLSEIHQHYSLCLVLFGRNDEALVEMQRAIALDPFVLRFNLNWARILFFMRQQDRAIDQFRKTLELDANLAAAHEWLGYAFEQKGMGKEAIAQWIKASTLSGEVEQAAILERVYAASGIEAAVRASAQKRLERLNERTRGGEYVPAGEYVTAYTRSGDKEQAFAWLAKAVEERNRLVLEIKISPIFDSLRSDSRFAKLMRRVEI